MKYLRTFWPVYLTTAALFLLVIAWGSRSVTVIAENTPVERKHIIVVDAGHGGVDGGATSSSGVLEKQTNLEIALRLDDLLHFLGFDTVMIRTTDISVYTEGETIAAKKASDLKKRVSIVNGFDNSILVSIHQNTYPDGRYSGAQVFYNDFTARNMAESLQANFIKAINPDSNRRCKKASGVYLMQHIQRPGLLIECGFISNPQEDAALQTGAYQKKLCGVIACSLSQMLSNT